MIINANALYLPIASNSVQCIVTSPPYYGLRDYGVEGQIGLEQTPAEYVSNIVAVFAECWRVLRDDGVAWLNLGDSYAGSGKGAGEDAGAKQQTNREWAIDKSKRNASRWGGGNIPASDGLKPKDLIGIPWRVAFALQAVGWWLRQDIIWHKPNPMPESVTDRCTKAHEYVFLLTKSARYFYDAEAVREESSMTSGWFKQREKGKPFIDNKPEGIVLGRKTDPNGGLNNPDIDCTTRNLRSVWSITTKPFSGAHFACMPPELAETCIKAGSKRGDLVLDPFAGSGTTGMVAVKLGREFVGTELNYKYIHDVVPLRMKGIQVEML